MMIAKRTITCLLAVFMLVSVFSGCSTSEPQTPDGNTQSSSSQAASTSTATESAAAETPAFTEVTEINALIYDLRGCAQNAQPIIDKMNEITEKTAGVKIAKATWAGAADWVTQVGLAMASNEQYDVMTIIPRPGADFTTLASNGQLTDITQYMQNEGAATYDLTKDYIGAYSIEGKIYGVPTYRNYTSGIYLVMRKDILDQVGMTEKAQNLKSWTEAEEIFAAVAALNTIKPLAGQKNISYQNGTLFGSDSFSGTTVFDNLSDNMRIVYTDQTGKVSLLQENPEYRKQMEMVKKWYDNGWVYEDSLVVDDHVDTMMKAGVTFASIQTSELGVETAKREATGYEVVCAPVATNMLSSNFVNKFGICVPITSKEPEAAVRWINAIYTDPEVINLFVWGVEGEDYVMDGGEAAFPEGITAENVKYHEADFVHGNFFNVHPWKGQGADFRTRAHDALTSAKVSNFLGFSPNMADLSNTIASITSIMEEMDPRFYCGAWTDDYYNEYVSRMRAAGADDYIASLQKQLDDWKAANK